MEEEEGRKEVFNVLTLLLPYYYHQRWCAIVTIIGVNQ